MTILKAAVAQHIRLMLLVLSFAPLGLSLPEQHWTSPVFTTVNQFPESGWRIGWAIAGFLLVLAAVTQARWIHVAAMGATTGVTVAWFVAISHAKFFLGANLTWGALGLWSAYLGALWLTAGIRPDG